MGVRFSFMYVLFHYEQQAKLNTIFLITIVSVIYFYIKISVCFVLWSPINPFKPRGLCCIFGTTREPPTRQCAGSSFANFGPTKWQLLNLKLLLNQSKPHHIGSFVCRFKSQTLTPFQIHPIYRPTYFELESF